MNTLKRIALGVACGGMLLSAGCVKLWTKPLDIKTYMVVAERVSAPVEKPLADKLWVDTVSVLPPFNVRNLVLRKTDVEYETSYYSELLLSPSENFRNNVYTWFSSSGIFQDVSMVSRSGMTHRLTTTVMDFYGDTAEGKAVLKIKATLFDEKAKGMRVLFSHDYLQQVDVADTTAEELIRAYNKALAHILAELEQDLTAGIQSAEEAK